MTTTDKAETRRLKLNAKAKAWLQRREEKRANPRNTPPSSPKKPRGLRKLYARASIY